MADITGDSGDNTLNGTPDNDTISGLGGNDRLFGGAGIDTLIGGEGDDYLDATDFQAGETYDGGEGFDTFRIDSYFGTNDISGVNLIGVERVEVGLYSGTGSLALTAAQLAGLSGGVDAFSLTLTTAGSVALDSDSSRVRSITFSADGNTVDLTAGSFGGEVPYLYAFGGAAADTLIAGATRVVAAGGGGNDNLAGGTANDTLAGDAGDDALNGGAGNDTLDGGDGADTLAGGAGDDIYYLDDAADVMIEGAGDGTDEARAGVSYTLAGGVHVERLRTADGASGTAAIDLTGNELGNEIIGNAAANVLDGGAGNDVLRGGDGADTMIGGAGDDHFEVGLGGGDVIVEAAGGGIDTVTSWITYTLTSEVENLILNTSGAAQNGFGNALANSLTGNDQANILDGGVGADTLIGQGGNDKLYVDNAGDMVVEASGDGTDRVFASVSYTLAAGQEIEILSTTDNAGTGAIHLAGNGFANNITGNAGFNRLDGRSGADTLSGLGGDDWYYVDNAADVVIEAAGGGSDRVFASVSYALGAGAHVETLTTTNNAGTSAINLTGNGFANSIAGNNGTNVLNGGAGADTLNGLGGNDLLYVDNAADVIVEAAGGGSDRVLASVSYALGAAAQVEILSTTNNGGTGAINLTGNGFANSIAGNNGVNVLNGGAGADTLNGLGGNDLIYVDNAADVVIEAAGGGSDRVFASVSYVLGAAAQVEILSTTNNAGTGAINLTGNGFANSIAGNNGNNVLNGLGGADTLNGLGGNDLLFVDNTGDVIVEAAGGGNDRVFVSVSYVLGAAAQVETLSTTDHLGTVAIDLTGNGFGNTIAGNAAENALYGLAGADTLSGWGGDDVLTGGDGNDVLDGGDGNDTLTGGAGADTIRFTVAPDVTNVDIVGGYSVADDVIQIENAVFTGLAAGALAAGAFNTGAAATQADDRIIYNTTTGALLFDADGTGSAIAVQFATLSVGLAMTAGEFMVI